MNYIALDVLVSTKYYTLDLSSFDLILQIVKNIKEYNKLIFGSSQLNRFISKNFQYHFVNVFLSIIEPKFTFFNVQIEVVFSNSSKFCQANFA